MNEFSSINDAKEWLGGSALVIYGGNRIPSSDLAYQQAKKVGLEAAKRGVPICTGGDRGIMKAVAEGSKAGNGKQLVVLRDGVSFEERDLFNATLHVNELSDRVVALEELGDQFVVFPGGSGTLLEIAYVLERSRKRFQSKNHLYFVGDFWKPILQSIQNDLGPFLTDSSILDRFHVVPDLLELINAGDGIALFKK